MKQELRGTDLLTAISENLTDLRELIVSDVRLATGRPGMFSLGTCYELTGTFSSSDVLRRGGTCPDWLVELVLDDTELLPFERLRSSSE